MQLFYHVLCKIIDQTLSQSTQWNFQCFATKHLTMPAVVAGNLLPKFQTCRRRLASLQAVTLFKIHMAFIVSDYSNPANRYPLLSLLSSMELGRRPPFQSSIWILNKSPLKHLPFNQGKNYQTGDHIAGCPCTWSYLKWAHIADLSSFRAPFNQPY